MLDQLQSDLNQAQLQRDEIKVSTLRLLISEIRNAQIAKGGDLSDEEIQAVVRKEVKKRKEGAAGFRQGGREELAKKEEAEARILQSYLPAEMSDEELTKMVEEAINEVGAVSASDMGKVMSVVMGKVAGRADGSRVSTVVRENLTK